MLDNGIQLLGEALFHNFRKFFAVNGTRALPAHALKILLCALHIRRIGALWNRTDFLDHVIDAVGIRHHNFIRGFLSEIAEFLQHFLGRAVIQPHIAVGIRKFQARKQNFSIDLILPVQKMRVARCNDRLSKFFPQSDDFPIQRAKPFVVRHFSLRNKKAVVADRLNFQIIIKFRNFFNFLL